MRATDTGIWRQIPHVILILWIVSIMAHMAGILLLAEVPLQIMIHFNVPFSDDVETLLHLGGMVLYFAGNILVIVSAVVSYFDTFTN